MLSPCKETVDKILSGFSIILYVMCLWVLLVIINFIVKAYGIFKKMRKLQKEGIKPEKTIKSKENPCASATN